MYKPRQAAHPKRGSFIFSCLVWSDSLLSLSTICPWVTRLEASKKWGNNFATFILALLEHVITVEKITYIGKNLTKMFVITYVYVQLFSQSQNVYADSAIINSTKIFGKNSRNAVSYLLSFSLSLSCSAAFIRSVFNQFVQHDNSLTRRERRERLAPKLSFLYCLEDKVCTSALVFVFGLKAIFF